MTGKIQFIRSLVNKNRILYIILFFFSFVFIYFYGGLVPYMFFNALLATTLVSVVYTFVVYLRFKFIQEIDKKFVVKGDTVNLNIKLYNEDFFLYPYIKVNFCGTDSYFAEQFQSRELSLLPKDIKNYKFSLDCKYRGCYNIGIDTIEIEDWLGIVKFTYHIKEKKDITVQPKIIELEKFDLKLSYMSDASTNLKSVYETYSTVTDYREYRYGDPLKKIHWKLSARFDNLIVKNYQATNDTSAVILLDLMRNPYSTEVNTVIEDKVVESAVAVIYYCLSNWIPLEFIGYGEYFYHLFAKNPKDFDDIYKLLSQIKFWGESNIGQVLEQYSKESFEKENLIIITSNLSLELYNKIYDVAFSGFTISLIYISSEEITKQKVERENEIVNSLYEIGVNFYKININEDIKPILERQL